MPSWRAKNNGWEIRWRAGGQQKSRMFWGNERQARQQAHIWEAEDGGRPNLGPSTLADALTAWQMRGGERDSPLSDKGVESRSRMWIIPHLGNLPIEKVTHLRLEAFYRERLEHLSHGYVKNMHWDISGALRLAVRDGQIRDNPADKVRFPRRDGKAEIVPPTREDLTAFLAHVDAKNTRGSAELALGTRIAIATGARLGEVCGLQWGDIDLDLPCIAIARNVISLPGGKIEVRETKTGVRRRAAIPAALVERIIDYREHWVLAAGSGDTEPLFVGAPGRHLSPGAFGTRFKKARREAGLTFRFHDLRHFAVSVWLTGMPIQDASRAVGHTQLATTAGTYGHRIGEAVDRRTADLIAAHIDL